MDKKEKFKKQQKDMKRYEAIRSFISSFTLTAIVVVAAAVAIPKSPVASIENVKTFESEIVYQVTVTDEDQALDLTSLEIVLDGQLEDYSAELDLGINVGIFDNLRPNTSYYLEVYGNKGFGQEKLTSMRVKTKASSDGAIISYEMTDMVDIFYTYEVEVLLSDEEALFEHVYMYYTYLYFDEEPQFYDMVEVFGPTDLIELTDIFSEHERIYIYLEAMLKDGSTRILDELTIYTPINLYTDIYLDQKTKSSLSFTFYSDYYFTENITYTAKIYDNKVLLEELQIETNDFEFHHGGSIITFDRLRKNVDYRVEIWADYIDPQTKRETSVLLHTLIEQTLDDYDISYEITYLDHGIDIYIYLNDPNHYFQIPYVIIYEIIDGQKFYFSETTYDFTPIQDGKEVTFEFLYPDLEKYEMVIGVRNQTDYTMNHIIIDEIIES